MQKINKQNTRKTILIAAGGTGGHIFPALAVAKELEHKYEIRWLGTKTGMESRLIDTYPLHHVHAVGIRGKRITTLLVAPFKLIWALYQTLRIIRKHKITCVIGFGGFVGGIGGLGALLSRTPLVIHEQNSIAGTSNKYLHKYATKNFTAFKGVLEKAQVCGNPISWQAKIKENKVQDKHIQGNTTSTNAVLNILVIGGSLGARALNSIVPTLGINVALTHQTGEKNYEEVVYTYRSSKLNAEVIAFISDMPTYYSKADIVICRAGAMTISELIKTTSVAILIPFPHAIDNHQYHNAKILADAGCAILIEEHELTTQKLEEELMSLDKNTILSMQDNFAIFDESNGQEIIAEYINTLLE